MEWSFSSLDFPLFLLVLRIEPDCCLMRIWVLRQAVTQQSRRNAAALLRFFVTSWQSSVGGRTRWSREAGGA